MNVQTCAAITVALLDIYVGTHYCMKMIRKEIYPRAATWLIFEIGVVMSLLAYFSSRDHSIVKAALNATDAIMVTIIAVAILIEQKGGKIRFTRNEYVCLVISCVTMAAWIFTKTGWIAFVGFQLVMTIAYLPTIESVWRWKVGPAPEHAQNWSVYAVIAFIGVVTDLAGRHDYMAMVYPLRALVLCGTIVVLVRRWEQKNKLECSPSR